MRKLIIDTDCGSDDAVALIDHGMSRWLCQRWRTAPAARLRAQHHGHPRAARQGSVRLGCGQPHPQVPREPRHQGALRHLPGRARKREGAPPASHLLREEDHQSALIRFLQAHKTARAGIFPCPRCFYAMVSPVPPDSARAAANRSSSRI